MPSVSSASAVAGTSRIDLAPEATTATRVRASSPRSEDTSGRCVQPRCTPPIPPVPMNRSPTVRATASVPPTVVAPTARWATAAARSRGPSLRALAPKRPSSCSSRPTRTSPSSTPIVAGVAPASRTRRSLSSPTAIPSPGGKPWAISVVSSATIGRPSSSAVRTSSEIVIPVLPSRRTKPRPSGRTFARARRFAGTGHPRRCRTRTAGRNARRPRRPRARYGAERSPSPRHQTLPQKNAEHFLRLSPRHGPERRDAAGRRFEPELRAADEVTGRERVARAGRVDDVGRRCGQLAPVRELDPLRPELQHPFVRRKRVADLLELLRVAEDHVGCEQLEPPHELGSTEVADQAPRREIHADSTALPTHRARGFRRRLVDRRAEERVARHVQPVRAAEPAHLELIRAQLRCDAAVRRHRPLPSGRDDRHDDAVVAVDGWAEHLDAVGGELLRDELPGRVGRPLRDEAALRSELGRPGGDVRCLAACAGARASGRVGTQVERRVESHDDVEEEISEGADDHRPTIVPWTTTTDVAE